MDANRAEVSPGRGGDGFAGKDGGCFVSAASGVGAKVRGPGT